MAVLYYSSTGCGENSLALWSFWQGVNGRVNGRSEAEEHVTIWGAENKMENLGYWIVLGIPRSYVRLKISPPLAQQSHERYT